MKPNPNPASRSRTTSWWIGSRAAVAADVDDGHGPTLPGQRIPRQRGGQQVQQRIAREVERQRAWLGPGGQLLQPLGQLAVGGGGGGHQPVVAPAPQQCAPLEHFLDVGAGLDDAALCVECQPAQLEPGDGRAAHFGAELFPLQPGESAQRDGEVRGEAQQQRAGGRADCPPARRHQPAVQPARFGHPHHPERGNPLGGEAFQQVSPGGGGQLVGQFLQRVTTPLAQVQAGQHLRQPARREVLQRHFFGHAGKAVSGKAVRKSLIQSPIILPVRSRCIPIRRTIAAVPAVRVACIASAQP